MGWSVAGPGDLVELAGRTIELRDGGGVPYSQ
jgi:hypothetical protein